MKSKAPKPLVCSFGEPWLGPHPLCRAETARVCECPIEDVPDPDLSHLRPEPVQLVLIDTPDSFLVESITGG